MPMVSDLLEKTPEAVPTLPDLSDSAGGFAPQLRAEAIKLFLPSGLTAETRKGRLVEMLLAKETELRVAQADDALSNYFITQQLLILIIYFIR